MSKVIQAQLMNIHDYLSVLHLNVRGIRNKINYLQDNFMDFEILCYSETHLDMTVSSELLFISNCYSRPYRKDRNMHGGGLLMYINTNLAHRHDGRRRTTDYGGLPIL